jgi:hypothetical protein
MQTTVEMTASAKIPTVEELAQRAFDTRYLYRDQDPHSLALCVMCDMGLMDPVLYNKVYAALATEFQRLQKPVVAISRLGWAAEAQARIESEAMVIEDLIEPQSLPDGQFVLEGIMPAP